MAYIRWIFIRPNRVFRSVWYGDDTLFRELSYSWRLPTLIGLGLILVGLIFLLFPGVILFLLKLLAVVIAVFLLALGFCFLMIAWRIYKLFGHTVRRLDE